MRCSPLEMIAAEQTRRGDRLVRLPLFLQRTLS